VGQGNAQVHIDSDIYVFTCRVNPNPNPFLEYVDPSMQPDGIHRCLLCEGWIENAAQSILAQVAEQSELAYSVYLAATGQLSL